MSRGFLFFLISTNIEIFFIGIINLRPVRLERTTNQLKAECSTS